MANDQPGSEEQRLLDQIETIFERRRLTAEERETVISAVTTLLLVNVAKSQSTKELEHEFTDPRRYPTWYPFVLCLILSGIRVGEAVGFQWRDVDLDRRVLIIRRTERRGRVGVPKSGKARRVDMSRGLRQALAELKSLQGAEAALAGRPSAERVFSMPNGLAIHDDSFRNHVWRPILSRAGLRYRKPHTLRHTFASLLIEAGESLKYVQEQLGHHSPAFTLSVYGHLIPRGDRRAVDRLDDVTGRTPGAIEPPEPDTLFNESSHIHPEVSELPHCA